MTIKQVLSATKSGGDDDGFTVGGREVHQVRVVGNVYNVDKKETKTTYTIEDQTGMIEATMWVNEEEVGEATQERLAKMVLGSYVCVIGAPKEYNGKLSVSAYDVRPIEDFNEITHHFLETMYSFAKHAKKLSAPAAAARPNSFGAFNASSGGGVSAMDTSDAVDGALSPEQSKVFNFYTSEGTGDEGCNVNYVSESLSMDLTRVKQIVEFLSSEGHLYSTIDDDHHKSTSDA